MTSNQNLNNRMDHYDRRLGHLEDTFQTFASKTTDSLHSITASISDISADIKSQNTRIETSQPKDWMDYIKAGLVLGAFFAMLIAGVDYVTDSKIAIANHEADKKIQLLEYKLEEHIDNKWKTSLKRQ